MHFRKGFSLIELLVVVAIIAILAGIALPTYQKNSTRARVAELVKVLDGLTHQVLISYNAKGKIPDTLENVSGLGAGSYSQYIIPQLTTHLHYNSGSTWSNQGAMIQITVDPKVGRAIPGFIESTIGTDGAANSFVMAFVDDGGTIKVYCGRWNSASTLYIPIEYLPSGCKSDDIAALVTGN